MPSLYDFRAAQAITAQEWPFNALLMALLARADLANYAKLSVAFPDVVCEFEDRRVLPGGLLPGEVAPEDLRVTCDPERGGDFGEA